MDRGYLLDTNILLAVLRGNALGKLVDRTYALHANLNRSLISVVSIGELLSLARQLGWGQTRIDRLNSLVDQLVLIDINSSPILNAYGEIDHYSRSVGRSMGKNDVWIAATAHVTGVIDY